jgi:hypothetical protein
MHEPAVPIHGGSSDRLKKEAAGGHAATSRHASRACGTRRVRHILCISARMVGRPEFNVRRFFDPSPCDRDALLYKMEAMAM